MTMVLAASWPAKLASGRTTRERCVPGPARCSQKARSFTAPEPLEHPGIDPSLVTARRSLFGLAAGACALLSGVSPSLAAYGEGANVFGKSSNSSGFIPYRGEDFAFLLPSKWNPSREREFKDIKVRYEDNGDAVNNVMVIARKTDKQSLKEYGSPEEFLKANSELFGTQTFTGQTRSEGGFKQDKVSAASILDIEASPDKNGKLFYKYNILVRSADGDEGGRHQLLTATVNNGKLYLLKVQVGDKRWFKGAKASALGIINSFSVA